MSTTKISDSSNSGSNSNETLNHHERLYEDSEQITTTGSNSTTTFSANNDYMPRATERHHITPVIQNNNERLFNTIASIVIRNAEDGTYVGHVCQTIYARALDELAKAKAFNQQQQQVMCNK